MEPTTLVWTATRGVTKAEFALEIVGDRAEVVTYLEAQGYEVEAFTDQVDAYTRDRSGRRRLRLTLMP